MTAAIQESIINTLLAEWKIINTIRRQAEGEENVVKAKILAFLKERGWKSYRDKESGVSTSVVMKRDESFDRTQLRLLLGEKRYHDCMRWKETETVILMSPDSRNKLQRYVKRKV